MRQFDRNVCAIGRIVGGASLAQLVERETFNLKVDTILEGWGAVFHSILKMVLKFCKRYCERAIITVIYK
uniref:Uncharacterized protein n=1 Tax=Caenorhabditis japonica TaxID=281687 RepID=A0A8R1DGH2_CAEJA